MPSLLPVLSYDLPTVAVQDGGSSIPVPNDSSNIVIVSDHGKVKPKHQKERSAEKKKKSKKQVKAHGESEARTVEEPTISLPETVISEKQASESADTVVKAQAIADAVKLMKTAVYAVQMALLNGLKSDLQLRAATCILTQNEYADVVSERSIVKQCGFPLCENVLKVDKSRKGRYHISLREHKVYDLEETRLYCSTDCIVASRTFSASLPASREGIVEHEKLEEIVSCVRGLNISASTDDRKVPTTGLVLHEHMGEGVKDFEESESDPSDAIEGYTPRKYVPALAQTLPSWKEEDDPGRKGARDARPPKLKSAIKQSPRKHQRISWADEKADASKEQSEAVAQPEDTFSFATVAVNMLPQQVSLPDSSILGQPEENRLESAQAIAAALSEAATASKSGEVEAYEAASSAGLSIVSPGTNLKELSASTADAQQVPVADTELAEEDLDIASPWYDAPPKAFNAEVSMFGMIWMALDGWISAATVAHIYGRDGEAEEFRDVNGRVETQVVSEDGSSAEILRTISSCIDRALPDVAQALRISIPISVLEQAVGRLLRTMNLIQALPPLTTKHWHMISVLFLDALSVHCLSALGTQLTNNRALLQKVLSDSGTSDSEYEAYKELLLPLGRLPSFSTMRGG